MLNITPKPNVFLQLPALFFSTSKQSKSTSTPVNKIALGAILGVLTGAGAFWLWSHHKVADLSLLKHREEQPENRFQETSKENTIKALRKKWSEDSFAKLLANKKNLESARHSCTSKYINRELERLDAADILFSRASEIKEALKETHVVFVHSQPTEFLACVYLINMLFREKSERQSHLSKLIRIPGDAQERDIQEVISKLTVEINGEKVVVASDHDFPTALMSVDACFANRQEGESAYSMLKNNVSFLTSEPMFPDPDIWRPTGVAVMGLANHSMKMKAPLASHEVYSKYFKEAMKIQEIGQKLQSSAPCGNLFVICIPKPLLDDGSVPKIAYRSHPVGIPCDCHEASSSKEILEKLQKDIVDETTECIVSPYNRVRGKVPQYRLLAPALRSENGVLCILLTPFDKKVRAEIKKEVKTIADAFNP